MAIVYRAIDRKHDRPVAIKVMRPEIAAAMGRERFPCYPWFERDPCLALLRDDRRFKQLIEELKAHGVENRQAVFERDLAVVFEITREIDRCHPADTELPLDGIAIG